jgi:hypothetical protein
VVAAQPLEIRRPAAPLKAPLTTRSGLVPMLLIIA